MDMYAFEKSPAFHGTHNYRPVADAIICPMFKPLVPAQNLVK